MICGVYGGGFRILSQGDKDDWINCRGDWEVIPGVVDSGVVVHVSPKHVAAHVPTKEAEASRKKVFYTSAGGQKIYNQGEKMIEGFMGDGVAMSLPTQVADVSKPLFSVWEMKKVGSATIFGLSDKHAIINT